MEIIDNVRLLRKRAKERRERSFILNRDGGCVFCKRLGLSDEPFHRYITNSDDEQMVAYDYDTKKKYAICEWHRKILWDWADAKKQNEMLDYLHKYLKDAQKPF